MPTDNQWNNAQGAQGQSDGWDLPAQAQSQQRPVDQAARQADQSQQRSAGQQFQQQVTTQSAVQATQQFQQRQTDAVQAAQQASAAQTAQQQWQTRQQQAAPAAQPAAQQQAASPAQPGAQQQPAMPTASPAQPAAQQQATPDVQQQAMPGAQQWQQPPAGQGTQQHWQAGQQFNARQQAQSVPPAQGAYAASMPYQAAPPQKKGHGWIVAIVVIVCLFAFSAFAVKSCTDAMATLPTTGSSTGLDDLSGDTIGIINLDGTIQYDGSLCSPEGLKEMLDKAQENSHIKAIVLRVNSGGGVATAGEEMAEYLRQFEKPIVVSSASINASAAYEISAQANYIYVAKSTEIGSIGTAMELTDLSGLFEKLGISMDTITSADSKDSTYGYRSLTEDERAYYQKMVEQINDMFIENVAVGRDMDEKDVRKLATGLVFTGVDAVDNGLADAIGTREDAIKKAAELAGITDYDTTNLVLPSYDISSLAYLFGDASSSSTDELVNALRGLQENQNRTK